MFSISRAALAALVASAFSNTRVLAVDYTISIGGTPVTVNGFNEANDSAELTMEFTLADGANTEAGLVCEAFVASAGQCDVGTSITAIATTPTVTVNDVSVAVNIDLATIDGSGGYSYDAGTKIGTLNFCTRCSTSDGTAGEIDYAETLATVTILMEETIPTITANVQETAATTDTQNAGAADYVVNAFQCTGAKAPDSSTLAQGDYLNVCVNFAQAGVDCDHFETLLIDAFGVVTGGSIVNAALTTGDDSAAPSSDGTCIITTQFPSALIPADGTAGTVDVTGSVVIHFGRRKLRVNFSTDAEEQRALQADNGDVVDFEMQSSVQASKDAPFEGSSAAASGVAGAALAVGALMLMLAV